MKTSPTHPHILIAGTYIPQNQPLSTYSNFCVTVDDILCSQPECSPALLFGAFSLPDINWMDPSAGHMSCSSCLLCDNMNAHCLSQINVVPNARGVLLDLVFSSLEHLPVFLANEPILNIDPAHLPLCLLYLPIN